MQLIAQKMWRFFDANLAYGFFFLWDKHVFLEINDGYADKKNILPKLLQTESDMVIF